MEFPEKKTKISYLPLKSLGGNIPFHLNNERLNMWAVFLFCFTNDLIYLQRLNKLEKRLIMILQSIFICQVLLFHRLFVTRFYVLFSFNRIIGKCLLLKEMVCFYQILTHDDSNATRLIFKTIKVGPIV